MMKWTLAVVSLLVLLIAVACDQNVERVNSDERIENAPPVDAGPTPGPIPPADFTEAPGAGAMSGVPERMPVYKVFFMHRFIEALYSVPKNKMPNPAWKSPLKDPVEGRVWCTDCHRADFDFANMPSQRFPQTEDLENNHEFMVELMTKWVTRLNSDEFRAKVKLKEEVTCTTCHAQDPRE